MELFMKMKHQNQDYVLKQIIRGLLIDIQENIPVGCILPACLPYVHQEPDIRIGGGWGGSSEQVF